LKDINTDESSTSLPNAGPAALKDRTPVAIPDDTCPCREACSPLSDPCEEERISKYLEEAKKVRLYNRKGVTMTPEGRFHLLPHSHNGI
jgi:hypothetical protein